MAWRIMSAAFAAAYAVFVFVALSVFRLPPRAVGLVAALFALAMLFSRPRGIKARLPFLILALIAIAACVSQSALVLKAYPVAANLLMLLAFSLSLSKKGGIVHGFALLLDKSLRWSARGNAVKRYCSKVTAAWCAFFAFNASASLYTCLFKPIEAWALYNGLVSYILIALMFAAEYAARLCFRRGLRRPVFISSMQRDSREDDAIVAYSGLFGEGRYKYWLDFIRESAAIREAVKEKNAGRAIICCEDNWRFAVSLCAVLSAGKAAVIPSSRAEGFISEIAGCDAAIIFDGELSPPATCAAAIGYEAAVSAGGNAPLSFAPIGKGARVILYTSGSTGRPKAVPHDLWELEDDNDSLGDLYRKDFQRRVLISSAYPSHAFGIVFSIIKPLIYSIPIRRERLASPDDLRAGEDADALLVTTPSFLKMILQDEAGIRAKKLRPMRIVAAGSPLEREVSIKAAGILGSAPIEIYGSTETGAIAMRVNKAEGDEWWTANKSVELRTDSEGVLSVRGNGVHGGGWIATSDAARIRDDGRFILLGRRGSIVKIAEKRVSLQEVSRRVMETGFASDAVAVLYEKGRRPAIACVLALSERGKDELGGMSHAERVKRMRRCLLPCLDPVAIPRRWRFVRELPLNAMGKIQMEEVMAILERGCESEGL